MNSREIAVRHIVQQTIQYPPCVSVEYVEHKHNWGYIMFLTALGITYQFSYNRDSASLTFSDVYWECVDPDKVTVEHLAPLFKRDYTDELK